MAMFGPEHFRLSLSQTPLRSSGRGRGSQSGQFLIDGSLKIQPKVLTVSYGTPRSLTLQSSEIPENALLRGKSSAILIQTNPFLRTRGSRIDIVWFKGRFEGLRWSRNVSRDELTYTFIGRMDDLDFWAQNEAGGSRLGFGGGFNETIRSAMLRLFLLHRFRLLRERFDVNQDFANLLPRTTLPALLIENKKFSEILNAIIQFAPTFRWIVQYGSTKDTVIFHNFLALTSVEVTTTENQIIDIDIDISSRGLASAVQMTGNISKFSPPVHAVLQPDWVSGSENTWTIRDFQSFVNLTSGGGSALSPPADLTDNGILDSLQFGKVFRRWKVTNLVWFKQIDRTQPITLLQRIVRGKRRGKEEFIWVSLQISSIDWDRGVVTAVWPVTIPIAGGDPRDTSRWTDDSNLEGKAKAPESGDVILGGHISAATIPSLRVPQVGFTGSAFNDFGITREIRVSGVEASKITRAEAVIKLAIVSEPRITGRVTLRGLRDEFINLGRRLVIRSPSNSLGLDNFQFRVVRAVFDFQQNTTALELSTGLVNPDAIS